MDRGPRERRREKSEAGGERGRGDPALDPSLSPTSAYPLTPIMNLTTGTRDTF